MLNKKVLLIAFLGTFLSVLLQEINLLYLNNEYPFSHNLITCADEYSYLQPANSFLETGEWTAGGSSGMIGRFMRPPGFGIYFLVLKFCFGSNVWLAMKIVQIIFSFLSVILFSKIVDFLNVSSKSNLIFTSIFAFLPCFSGFMYFTITESITPFFMLLSTYFWIKTCKTEIHFPIGFILSSAFLILIRPQLLVFILLFSGFLFFKKRHKTALYSLLAFLPFLLWNIRTVYIAGEWLGIHPIYAKTNNSSYRPSHEKMTDLFRIWEHQGDVFHTSIGTLSRDTTTLTLNLALKSVPLKYQKEVKPIFHDYQQLEHYRQANFDKTEPLKGFFKGEKEFLVKIEKTRKLLIRQNKVDYYFLTPFKSLQKLVISSHLNLRIFQAELRGTFFGESLRWLCLVILVFSYFASGLIIFRKKLDEITVLSLGIILSFFYLAYIQRMNEERYITPIIPIALLVSSFAVQKVFKRKIVSTK